MSESNTPSASKKVAPIGPAFLGCKAIFDGLSNKDRLELLKSLGGLYGHRVLPGLGAGAQNAPVQAVKAGKVPKGPAQPSSQKSAEQISVGKEISRLNREISSASKAVGSRLPEGHPLLEEREKLFRALSALKSKEN